MYSVTGRTGKRWSAEKIERVERRAARLGDFEKFVMDSPLLPLFVVLAFVGYFIGAHWVAETVTRWILG